MTLEFPEAARALGSEKLAEVLPKPLAAEIATLLKNCPDCSMPTGSRRIIACSVCSLQPIDFIGSHEPFDDEDPVCAECSNSDECRRLGGCKIDLMKSAPLDAGLGTEQEVKRWEEWVQRTIELARKADPETPRAFRYIVEEVASWANRSVPAQTVADTVALAMSALGQERPEVVEIGIDLAISSDHTVGLSIEGGEIQILTGEALREAIRKEEGGEI